MLVNKQSKIQVILVSEKCENRIFFTYEIATIHWVYMVASDDNVLYVTIDFAMVTHMEY